MTERLYYTDSFLSEFDGTVSEIRRAGGRTAVLLDRSAFYPASGGQVFDTGWLVPEKGTRLRVEEVAEDENGEVLHFVAVPASATAEASSRFLSGTPVHGNIDFARRRDHMQQHSGQHVLSAAFVRLFQMPTVSFHMGEYVEFPGASSPASPKSCTIDLDTKSLDEAQLHAAEALANAVVSADHAVQIRFATPEEARSMGVRKIPPEVRDQLRLIDIQDFDLNACGGTHVRSTGQIGPILLRKTEKVRQGLRVEFVCGERALQTAGRDYATLIEAAGLYSTHIWELPQQVRKSLDEIKAGQKERKKLLEELAELYAARLRSEVREQDGWRLIVTHFEDRDAPFIKLVGQKAITASAADAAPVVALLSASGGPQPALVFAQSAGGPYDMGALMKDTMDHLGGRGGGNRDLAQGGVPAGTDLAAAIAQVVLKLRS